MNAERAAAGGAGWRRRGADRATTMSMASSTAVRKFETAPFCLSASSDSATASVVVSSAATAAASSRSFTPTNRTSSPPVDQTATAELSSA